MVVLGQVHVCALYFCKHIHTCVPQTKKKPMYKVHPQHWTPAGEDKNVIVHLRPASAAATQSCLALELKANVHVNEGYVFAVQTQSILEDLQPNVHKLCQV